MTASITLLLRQQLQLTRKLEVPTIRCANYGSLVLKLSKTVVNRGTINISTNIAIKTVATEITEGQTDLVIKTSLTIIQNTKRQRCINTNDNCRMSKSPTNSNQRQLMTNFQTPASATITPNLKTPMYCPHPQYGDTCNPRNMSNCTTYPNGLNIGKNNLPNSPPQNRTDC